MDKKNYLSFVLLLFILFGVFLRLYNLDEEYLWDDEQPWMLAEIKFHQQGFYDGTMFFQEPPPLGKWFLGLPTLFIPSNYQPLTFLGPNFFAWKHIAYESLRDNFVAIRFLNALLGVFALLATFLLVKKTFGTKPALWSTALFALSADFILNSRHDNLGKMTTVAFGLFCLYFYSQYLSEKDFTKKWIYLGVTFLFLLFALGTRNYDPLFLLPTLIVTQFIIHFGKKHLTENILIALFFLFSFFLVFKGYYPSAAQEFAKFHLEVSSPLALFGFGLFGVFKNMFLRNSYLYTIISLALIVVVAYNFMIIKKKKGFIFQNFLETFKTKNLSILLFVFFFVTFFGLSFTQSRFGYGTGYNVMLFAATILLSGKIIHFFVTQWKFLAHIFIVLLAITAIQFTIGFPYSLWDYSNLGDSYPYYPNVEDQEVIDQILFDMETKDYPPLMTDSLNVLLFYPKDKIYPLPIAHENYCNHAVIENIQQLRPYFFFRSGNLDNEYLCPIFKTANLHVVKAYDAPNTPTLYTLS